jgi:hypothetical protein
MIGAFLAGVAWAAPVGLVWMLGFLTVWSHVCGARLAWDQDRERRLARRRLRRSVAAWRRFQAAHPELLERR